MRIRYKKFFEDKKEIYLDHNSEEYKKIEYIYNTEFSNDKVENIIIYQNAVIIEHINYTVLTKDLKDIWFVDWRLNKVKQRINLNKEVFLEDSNKTEAQKFLNDIKNGKKEFSKEEFNKLDNLQYDLSSGISIINMYGVYFLHLLDRRFKIKINKDKSFIIIKER